MPEKYATVEAKVAYIKKWIMLARELEATGLKERAFCLSKGLRKGYVCDRGRLIRRWGDKLGAVIPKNLHHHNAKVGEIVLAKLEGTQTPTSNIAHASMPKIKAALNVGLQKVAAFKKNGLTLELFF